MVILELAIVLFFIYVGARIGGIGIGLAGGAGVIVLTMGFGLKSGSIPIFMCFLQIVKYKCI